MRSGSSKGNNARKVLSFYRVNFGFDPPFQVLLDAEMMYTAIKNNLYIKHALPTLLNASSHIVVTSCIVRALREAGESRSSAALFAKRATRIPCAHEGKKSALDCIKSRLTTPFETKLMLGSNDTALFTALGAIPGIPLISTVNDSKLVLRPPTKSTLDYIQNCQSTQGALLTGADKVLVDRVRAKEQELKDARRTSIHKRKRAKAPNPLSVKKSKKKMTESFDPNACPDVLHNRSSLLPKARKEIEKGAFNEGNAGKPMISVDGDKACTDTGKGGRKRSRCRRRQKSDSGNCAVLSGTEDGLDKECDQDGDDDHESSLKRHKTNGEGSPFSAGKPAQFTKRNSDTELTTFGPDDVTLENQRSQKTLEQTSRTKPQDTAEKGLVRREHDSKNKQRETNAKSPCGEVYRNEKGGVDSRVPKMKSKSQGLNTEDAIVNVQKVDLKATSLITVSTNEVQQIDQSLCGERVIGDATDEVVKETFSAGTGERNDTSDSFIGDQNGGKTLQICRSKKQRKNRRRRTKKGTESS